MQMNMGNLTSITPPGKPQHRFEYDGMNQVKAYHAPSLENNALTPRVYHYNLDGDLLLDDQQSSQPAIGGEAEKVTYHHDKSSWRMPI